YLRRPSDLPLARRTENENGDRSVRAVAVFVSVVGFVESAGFLPRPIVANRDADPPVAQLDEERAFTGFAHPPPSRFGETVRFTPLGESEDAIIVTCAIASTLPLPARFFV